MRKIKTYLEIHGIKAVTGKTERSISIIDRMLSNQKYAGQVLMQKSYTPVYPPWKKEQDCEQLTLYLVENAHEPIMDRETFARIQDIKGRVKQAAHMEQAL